MRIFISSKVLVPRSSKSVGESVKLTSSLLYYPITMSFYNKYTLMRIYMIILRIAPGVVLTVSYLLNVRCGSLPKLSRSFIQSNIFIKIIALILFAIKIIYNIKDTDQNYYINKFKFYILLFRKICLIFN